MATRQYIGARYTTKIYENTNDPSTAEWQSGVSYEPLTLVTYQNSSYLSKKAVPSNIGNPAANPTYWVITGAYNGQIATLQQQIDTINDTTIPAVNQRISRLNTDYFNYRSVDDVIVIGDSWGNGLHATHGLAYWLNQRLPHNNFYQAVENGAGFVNTGGSGHTFLQLLQGVTVADVNAVKHVIVVGGINDHGKSGVTDAITTFYNYARQTYPNAGIDIVIVNRPHMVIGSLVTAYDYIADYILASYQPRLRVLNITHKLPISNWYDDGHMNEAGYSVVGFLVKAALLGDSLDLQPITYTVTGTNTALNKSGAFTFIQSGSDICLITPTLANITNADLGSGTFKRIDFTFDNIAFGNTLMSGETSAYIRINSVFSERPMRVYMPDSTHIRFEFEDENTDPYQSIYINPCTINFGSLY